MQKRVLFFLIFGSWVMPATAEDSLIEDLKKDEAVKEKRVGPATATDKIIARFMALNSDPEESAGVSFEEYLMMVIERAELRFSEMDANHDEEVTEEEYRQFWTLRKAQWYRLKH